MGLLDWIKGRRTTTTTVTTSSVTKIDRGSDSAAADLEGLPMSPSDRAMIDEIDHLMHEAMTGPASGGATAVTIDAGTSIYVDGQAVDADDPRARAAIGEAAAKLRAQGFDDLAGDLEQRLRGSAGAAQVAADAPAPTSSPAESAPGAVQAEPPLPSVDEAPSPPTPPSPPSGSI